MRGSWRWPFSWAESALLATFPLALVWVGIIGAGSVAWDWRNYTTAAERFWTGGLYEVTDIYAFPYSPVLAMAFGAISSIGATAWRVSHVAAALALPSWPMRVAVLASWPFWFDVQHGNVVTFVVLAAAWAIRGNRAAQFSFLALAVLMPRPLMLPIVVWLLWDERSLRLPFVGLAIGHALAVVFTGWGEEWIRYLAFGASGEIDAVWNIGPSRLIGGWWIAIGLPLAAWLVSRGSLGLASLAASPYWLPYYLLFAVVGGREQTVRTARLLPSRRRPSPAR